MHEFSEKLAQLTNKEKNLQSKKSQLIEKRKKEVAELAAKYNLLSVPDSILNGAFQEIAAAVKASSTKVKIWEEVCLQQTKFRQTKNLPSAENKESNSSIDQD